MDTIAYPPGNTRVHFSNAQKPLSKEVVRAFRVIFHGCDILGPIDNVIMHYTIIENEMVQENFEYDYMGTHGNICDHALHDNRDIYVIMHYTIIETYIFMDVIVLGYLKKIRQS